MRIIHFFSNLLSFILIETRLIELFCVSKNWVEEEIQRWSEMRQEWSKQQESEEGRLQILSSKLDLKVYNIRCAAA